MNEFWDKLLSMEFGTAMLGALVGGGFTILGSAWQSRSANRATELAQARLNAQHCFDAVTQLRTHMGAQTRQGVDTAAKMRAWNHELHLLISSAVSSVMLLPDAYKDTRAPVMDILRKVDGWHGTPPWDEYEVKVNQLLTEAVRFLALFVRGSKAPQLRNVDEDIAETLNKLERRKARGELNNLIAEDEYWGLSPDEQARVQELQEFLGEASEDASS